MIWLSSGIGELRPGTVAGDGGRTEGSTGLGDNCGAASPAGVLVMTGFCSFAARFSARRSSKPLRRPGTPRRRLNECVLHVNERVHGLPEGHY